MPRFVTIGYGDREGYDRTPEPLRAAAHAQDAELQRRGALIGVAGRPIKVRNPEAKGVETAEGPYLSSPMPIAGFAVIEAADMAEATDLVSRVPCAICHGVIEVWPLETT